MIDIDIRAYFDSMPWDNVLKAVARYLTGPGGSACTWNGG